MTGKAKHSFYQSVLPVVDNSFPEATRIMHVAIGSPALWIVQAKNDGHLIIILAYAHETQPLQVASVADRTKFWRPRK